MVTIKYAVNGYIVSMDEADFVFEERDEQPKVHLQEMLYKILDLLGELGSKHDEERVCITVERKDHVESVEGL